MSVTVDIDFSENEILKNRHISDQRVWLFAAARFAFRCDDYIPFRTGTLKNNHVVSATADGAVVQWVSPYAHYQYYGKVMGPNTLTANGWRSFHKPKYYTGAALTYSGAGRGAQWDKKMLAAKRQDFLQDIAAYVGGVVD